MRVLAAAALVGLVFGRVEKAEDGEVTPWSPFLPFAPVKGNCNCDWISQPGACNPPGDGSPCWTECCGGPAPGPGDGCDCGWIHIPGACNPPGDGSKCWGECCNGPAPGPTPNPGPPGPTPPPGTMKPVVLVQEYYTEEEESNKLQASNGFVRTGGMRYHSQEKLNLLGGGLSFTVDLSRVNTLVNANLYLVIPGTLMGGSHFYCDNSENFVNQGNACIELDIFESNGHECSATTMHTKVGTGTGGCDTWGCRQMTDLHGGINGQRPFTVNVRVSNDGDITVQFTQDGRSSWAFNNAGGFDGGAKAAIVDGMRNHGAIVVSSMWTGWVPPNTVGKGDLDGSTYSLSNLMYEGVSKGRV